MLEKYAECVNIVCLFHLSIWTERSVNLMLVQKLLQPLKVYHLCLFLQHHVWCLSENLLPCNLLILFRVLVLLFYDIIGVWLCFSWVPMRQCGWGWQIFKVLAVFVSGCLLHHRRRLSISMVLPNRSMQHALYYFKKPDNSCYLTGVMSCSDA